MSFHLRAPPKKTKKRTDLDQERLSSSGPPRTTTNQPINQNKQRNKQYKHVIPIVLVISSWWFIGDF